MEFLMSGEFGRLFFVSGTVIVLAILWFGYYRSVFIPAIAWAVTGVFVSYMTSFLLYRYLTTHIAIHMAHQPQYILLAAIHGTISLGAILLACGMFFWAAPAYARGENFFREHRILSLTLGILWPLAFVSGLLI